MASSNPMYLIGRYELVREIGKGGFGAVEEYNDLLLSETVAIKTIPARFVNQESRRLVREIDIMRFLHHAHPHVIGYYTMFVTRTPVAGAGEHLSAARTLENIPAALNLMGPMYEGLSEEEKATRHHSELMQYVSSIDCTEDFSVHIVMPLMKGDLFYFIHLLGARDKLQQLGVTQEFMAQVAVVFAFQICFGLDYLHQCSIIHRDIKPDNVLVLLDVGNPYMSTALIADLGLARNAQHSDTIYICTRYYRPPEVITSVSRGSPRIDIWSLGCIFYELCTGSPLFMMRTALNERGEWDGGKASLQLEVILDTIGTPTPDDVERYMPQGNAKSYLLRSAPRPSKLRQKISDGWKLKVSEEEKEKWIDLISRCVSFFPEQRPTAQQLCQHQLFRDYNVFYGENVKQYEARHYTPTVKNDQDSTRAENKSSVLSIVAAALQQTPPIVGDDEEFSDSDEEEEGNRATFTNEEDEEDDGEEHRRPAYTFSTMSTRLKNDYTSIYAREEESDSGDGELRSKPSAYSTRYTPSHVYRQSSMIPRSVSHVRHEAPASHGTASEDGPVIEDTPPLGPAPSAPNSSARQGGTESSTVRELGGAKPSVFRLDDYKTGKQLGLGGTEGQQPDLASAAPSMFGGDLNRFDSMMSTFQRPYDRAYSVFAMGRGGGAAASAAPSANPQRGSLPPAGLKEQRQGSSYPYHISEEDPYDYFGDVDFTQGGGGSTRVRPDHTSNGNGAYTDGLELPPGFPPISDFELQAKYAMFPRTAEGSRQATTSVLEDLGRSAHDAERSRQLRELLNYYTSASF